MKLDCLIAVNAFLPPLYPDNSLTTREDRSDLTGQIRLLNQAVDSLVGAATVIMKDTKAGSSYLVEGTVDLGISSRRLLAFL